MSNPHSKLGDRIRKLLEDSGVSQRELSRRLKVGPNQVSRWVLGSVAPTYTVMHDILKTCRKLSEAGWLLTGKGSQPATDKLLPPNQSIQNTDEEYEMIQRELLDAKNEIIMLLKENSLLKDTISELTTSKKDGSLKSKMQA